MKRKVIRILEIVDLLAISVLISYLLSFSATTIGSSEYREASGFIVGLLVALYALVFPSVLSMLQDLKNSKAKIRDYEMIVRLVSRYATSLYQNMMVALFVFVTLFVFTLLHQGLFVHIFTHFLKAWQYALLSEILRVFGVLLQSFLLIDILASTKRVLDIKVTLNMIKEGQ